MNDFSSLINAVKPAQRTTRYKILAAFLSLGATVQSVTSAQVGELLKLNFGKRVPANLSAKLRSYTKYLKIVDAGPPLKWMLTPAALDLLESTSGRSLAKPAPSSGFGIDVGFVCALENPEFTALTAAIGEVAEWRDVSDASYTHIYRGCSLTTDSGKTLQIVATTSTSMGLTAASIVTTQLVMQFRPRLVVMVGIAAGTKEGEKQFGDVLVADPSVDYNSGKVVRLDGIREFQPDPYPISLNARLRSVLLRHRGANPILAGIRKRWTGKVPGSQNKLHVGPLGAADQVIDDADRVIEIQRNWRKLIGVEMETYGVYRACHEAPDPKPRVVSFKSVCDFAAQKSDSWQEYAAYTASEFAVGFLKKEWDALWPQSGD